MTKDDEGVNIYANTRLYTFEQEKISKVASLNDM